MSLTARLTEKFPSGIVIAGVVMAQTIQCAPRDDLSDLAKVDYLDRVNRAIDYITRNLSEPLRLEDVARVA